MDPMWAVLLLLLGLALIVLEVFIPSGGLLSLLAVISIVASVVIAFASGSRLGAAVLAAAVVLVPVVVGLAFRWWPRTPLGRLILIRPPDSEGEVLPDSEPYRLRETMVGKRGKAKTKMLPSGAVLIDGRTYEAVSDGEAIEPGQPIKVVAVRTNRIVVRSAKDEPPVGEDERDVLSRPVDSVVPDPFEDPLA